MADMTLEIWPSDFLLPSVDCKCLQFLACARICAAPIRIIRDCRPWASPSGQAPVFRHGTNIAYTNFVQFASHLRKQIPLLSGSQGAEIWSRLGGYGPFTPPKTMPPRSPWLSGGAGSQELTLDGHLSRAQHAEAMAFQALLQEKLYPAYLQTVWIDNPNFNTVTSRWYTSHLPVFYGIYFVGRTRRWAENYLREIYPGELVTDEDIEYEVIKQATNCIRMLSTKLADKKFFFGDRPSSLDALAFGYLAPLLKLPLPNDKLTEEIKKYSNLVRLIDSMISIYMPLSDEEITGQRQDLCDWEQRKTKAQERMRMKPKPGGSGEESSKDTDDEEYPLRDKILFAVGAGVIMLLFAVHFGIIQVEVKQEPSVERPRPDREDGLPDKASISTPLFQEAEV